jgi:hypothetical protein
MPDRPPSLDDQLAARDRCLDLITHRVKRRDPPLGRWVQHLVAELRFLARSIQVTQTRADGTVETLPDEYVDDYLSRIEDLLERYDQRRIGRGLRKEPSDFTVRAHRVGWLTRRIEGQLAARGLSAADEAIVAWAWRDLEQVVPLEPKRVAVILRDARGVRGVAMRLVYYAVDYAGRFEIFRRQVDAAEAEFRERIRTS